MKQIFIFLLILTGGLVFSQQKVMQGFGELKLGMTVQEVNESFKLNISESKHVDGFSSTNHNYIRITEDLALEGVELTFRNNSLILIRCDFKEHLHNGLSRIYGLGNKYSSSEGILFKYKTNSSQITCIGLYKNEMIIFNNQIKYPLVFKKINPALWELNKVEGFEGL